MQIFERFSQKKCIAIIDLYATEARAVFVTSHHEILHTAVRALPDGAYVNNRMVHEALLAPVIIDLLKDSPVPVTELIFIVPDAHCFFQGILIEKNKNALIERTSVEHQALEHVPMESSELVWDYVTQRDGDVKNTAHVIFVGIPRLIIEQYQSLASRLAIPLKGLEPEIFALTRFMNQRTVIATDTSVAPKASLVITTRGASYSLIVFDTLHQFVFSSTVSNQDINRLIQEIEVVKKYSLDQYELSLGEIIFLGDSAHIPEVEKQFASTDNLKVHFGVGNLLDQAVLEKIPENQFFIPSLIGYYPSGFIGKDFITMALIIPEKTSQDHDAQKKILESFLRNSFASRVVDMIKKYWPFAFLIATLVGLGWIVYAFIIAPMK